MACISPKAYALVVGLVAYPANSIKSAEIVTERVTLITGASAGIGTELARVFASNGHRRRAGGAPRGPPVDLGE